MYKIKVDNKYDFNFEKTQGTWQLDGKDVAFDMIEINKTSFSVLKDNKSYNVEIVNHNVAEKSFQIKVNQTIYNLTVKDKYDELLHQLGLDKAMVSKVSNIKAPMPGLIINVSVSEGTEVQKGDTLLILEAIKIENVIKSPRDGKVKKVNVQLKQAVEKNQVMLEFE